MASLEPAIHILLVDDHQMFIDGLAAIFSDVDDIQVVGKCFSGTEALTQCQAVNPQVVLLDINLPDMDGVEVCKKITTTHPDIKVIALTTHSESSFISNMLNNGAKGYVLKNSDKETLQQAIETVHRGETFLGEEVTQALIQGMMPDDKQSRTHTPKLTRREKEVLALIVEEYTTQEIADKLFISLNTVETHRRNLLHKLNVRNTAGLVRFTLEHKLLDE
ncbi:MAG: response regulator transcription factor [Bacteroidota bacterium]